MNLIIDLIILILIVYLIFYLSNNLFIKVSKLINKDIENKKYNRATIVLAILTSIYVVFIVIISSLVYVNLANL